MVPCSTRQHVPAALDATSTTRINWVRSHAANVIWMSHHARMAISMLIHVSAPSARLLGLDTCVTSVA